MGQVESGKRFTPNGTALTEGAIKRYRVVHKLVQAYSKEKNRGQDLSFESIDTRFVNEWKRWRADGATVGRIVNRPPVSSNVIRNDMKMLRMWMREILSRRHAHKSHLGIRRDANEGDTNSGVPFDA